MRETPWLTDAELQDATHRTRPTAQAKALKALGVPFGRRLDGTLLVGRDAMASALAGHKTPVAANGPRWSKHL